MEICLSHSLSSMKEKLGDRWRSCSLSSINQSIHPSYVLFVVRKEISHYSVLWRCSPFVLKQVVFVCEGHWGHCCVSVVLKDALGYTINTMTSEHQYIYGASSIYILVLAPYIYWCSRPNIYPVDPAGSYLLVLRIKPCMSKYKL